MCIALHDPEKHRGISSVFSFAVFSFAVSSELHFSLSFSTVALPFGLLQMWTITRHSNGALHLRLRMRETIESALRSIIRQIVQYSHIVFRLSRSQPPQTVRIFTK